MILINEIDLHINDFASRSFRDVADGDYITARMCYKNHLVSQFHWSALQAFEKYYKAILLFNRVKARDIGHNLAVACKYAEKLPFKIKLSASSVKLIEHLDTFGRFRYLDTSYYIKGPKLLELDKAVWEIRRYCRVINYDVKTPWDDTPVNMLEQEIDKIERAVNIPPQNFRIIQGRLETILDSTRHHARNSLIWQNGYYGKIQRKRVTIPEYVFAENSPLSLYPNMLDALREYIFIPGEVVEAYRNFKPD